METVMDKNVHNSAFLATILGSDGFVVYSMLKSEMIDDFNASEIISSLKNIVPIPYLRLIPAVYRLQVFWPAIRVSSDDKASLSKKFLEALITSFDSKMWDDYDVLKEVLWAELFDYTGTNELLEVKMVKALPRVAAYGIMVSGGCPRVFARADGKLYQIKFADGKFKLLESSVGSYIYEVDFSYSQEEVRDSQAKPITITSKTRILDKDPEKWNAQDFRNYVKQLALMFSPFTVGLFSDVSLRKVAILKYGVNRLGNVLKITKGQKTKYRDFLDWLFTQWQNKQTVSLGNLTSIPTMMVFSLGNGGSVGTSVGDNSERDYTITPEETF